MKDEIRLCKRVEYFDYHQKLIFLVFDGSVEQDGICDILEELANDCVIPRAYIHQYFSLLWVPEQTQGLFRVLLDGLNPFLHLLVFWDHLYLFAEGLLLFSDVQTASHTSFSLERFIPVHDGYIADWLLP